MIDEPEENQCANCGTIVLVADGCDFEIGDLCDRCEITRLTAALAAIRECCPCNCHEPWWKEQGGDQHAHCGECIVALMHDAEEDREGCMGKLSKMLEAKVADRDKRIAELDLRLRVLSGELYPID